MSYASTVLADSPLRYWRLGDASGAAVDSSTNATNGSYTGSPTLAQTGLIVGDAGKSALFNTHATDYMLGLTGHAPGLLSGQTNWTIELWMKTADTTIPGFYWVERGSTGNDIIRLQLDAGKTQLVMVYRDDAGTLNNVLGASGLALANSQPHHLVCVKSGTSVLLYIDGSQSGSTATLTASNTQTGAVFSSLGKDVQDGTGGLQATYAQEMAIYTTALSATRVSVHYRVGANLSPTNTVAPVASGSTTVGSVVSSTTGTWADAGSPTFTYQWQRDVLGNGVYTNIAAATSSTYTLVILDDGNDVRCVVTDTDVVGATAANSNSILDTTPPAGGGAGTRLPLLGVG